MFWRHLVARTQIASLNVGELMRTDLPQSLAEELRGRLAPLPLRQAVLEQGGVVLHRVGLLEDAVHQVEGVDVVLDEVVQGNLQLGGEGQQDPAEQQKNWLASAEAPPTAASAKFTGSVFGFVWSLSW